MESKHTKINLADVKLDLFLGKSKNTDFWIKCRPIKKHFYDFSERLCIAEPVVITGNKAMKVDSIHGYV